MQNILCIGGCPCVPRRLGLIHANHGGEHVDFFLDALKNGRDEVIKHGACLGLGLTAMATGREYLLEELLNGV